MFSLGRGGMRSRGAGFIAQETQGEIQQHKKEGKEKGKGEKRKREERYENKKKGKRTWKVFSLFGFW